MNVVSLHTSLVVITVLPFRCY